MSSTSNFLFQGSTPASFTSTSTNNPNVPAWWNDAVQGILTEGAAVANQPYQAYQGPRIASLNSTQNQAIDNASTLANQTASGSSPYVTQGSNMIQNGASGFNPDEFQSYLAPFTQGANSEISSLQDLSKQNLTENILPAVNQGFIANGMYGNASDGGVQSRNDLFNERALRDANTSLLQSEGSVLNNAYSGAMNSYLTGNNQKIAGGSAEGNLGTTNENIGLSNIGALNTLGQEQQNQTQNNYNLGYSDFLNQTQQPETSLQQFQSLLNGSSPTIGSTSYSTNPLSPGVVNQTGQGSGGSSFLSSVAAAAPLVASFFAEGGHVKSPRKRRKKRNG